MRKGKHSAAGSEKEKAIEEAIAEILEEVKEWKKAHPKAKYNELEEQVLQARKRMGEALMQELLEEREEARPVPGPRCPECGAEMHYKGEKKRRVVSSIGETEVNRGYYYCSKCQRSIFPPG
jgi:uncharacterized protein with PIN domain